MTSTSLTPAQRKAVLIGAVAAAVLVIVYLIAVLSSGDTARSGTKVGRVDIGGMSQAEAVAAVEQAYAKRAARDIKVVAGDVTVKVDPAQAGLSLDVEASVAPAFGRTWSPVSLLTAPFSGQQLDLIGTVDEAALAAEVAVLADAVATEPVEPTIFVRKGQARIKEGTPGISLDTEATAAAVREAFLAKRTPVEATLVETAPAITPEAAQAAVALADTATSAPITVVADTVRATLSGDDIGRALSFSAQGDRFVPSLNGARLHRAIKDELAAVETPGRDASFKIKGGTPRVVSSKVGRGVEDDELAAAVASVMGNPSADRTVTVSVGVRDPKVTTAQAVELGIREKLSTFTQSYPYAAYRSQNIGQAAKRINGTLLMPGETFSLNDTILERTKENGYTEGYVVGVGGVFQTDMGGGVSTSATATWTAAFFAGMERVQTVAHSIWISRYQAGLEATVAWGIFDLKFRNPYPTAVYIQASTTPTSITVTFWGTPEYDRIEAESGPKTNVVKYKKIYNESEDCREQGGIDGFTIVVDRVFFKGGEEVKREPITTTYKPAPQVICDKKPKKKKDPKDEQAEANGEFDPDAPPSPEATDQPKKDKPKQDEPKASASAKPSKQDDSADSGDPNEFSN